MDSLTDPRHLIGGNNPPPEAELSPYDKLVAEANTLIALGNRWTTERPEITDGEIAVKAGEFRDKLKEVHDALNKMRLAEQRDFESWLRERFGATLDMLARARAAIVGKIDAWLKAEDARRKREREAAEAEARRQQAEAEAARRRAEEAQRQAGADALRAQQAAEEAERRAAEATKAATAPAKVQIKGGSRTIALRTTWRARITDEAKALDHYRGHPVVRQAMLDAVQRIADSEAKLSKRAGEIAPGVEAYSEQKAA